MYGLFFVPNPSVLTIFIFILPITFELYIASTRYVSLSKSLEKDADVFILFSTTILFVKVTLLLTSCSLEL